MWNGFNCYFFSDRIYRIDGIFFACGEVPSAEGRYILTILLILSKGFSKIRIHSSSFSIKPAAFQASGGAPEYIRMRP